MFVVAIQIVYAIAGFEKFTEIDFFSQSGAPWYLFAMIVWYLTIPLVRKCKAVPVLLLTVVLALTAGYFKNVGDFLCLSRILVFGPFFYLGYFLEQKTLEKALQPKLQRLVVPCAEAICIFILAYGARLKDSLGMVYENISYYELEEVWKGPMVRLSLMIAAFLISWAIMFFIPRGKTRLSVIGQNTMPVYMLHRILRDILMFAGIYDYLGDWGWIAFFILLGLSAGIVYVLNNSHVVNQVNRILALHTPQLIRNLKRQRAR